MNTVPFSCRGCGCACDLDAAVMKLRRIFCPNCGKPARTRLNAAPRSVLNSVGTYGFSRDNGFVQSEVTKATRRVEKFRLADEGEWACPRLRLPAPPAVKPQDAEASDEPRQPPTLRIFRTQEGPKGVSS